MNNLVENEKNDVLQFAVKAFTKLKEESSKGFTIKLPYCGQTVVISLIKQSLSSWSTVAGRNESLHHIT